MNMQLPEALVREVKDYLSTVSQTRFHELALTEMYTKLYDGSFSDNYFLPKIKATDVTANPGFHRHENFVRTTFEFASFRAIVVTMKQLVPSPIVDLLCITCWEDVMELARSCFRFDMSMVDFSKLDANYGSVCSEESSKQLDALIYLLKSGQDEPVHVEQVEVVPTLTQDTKTLH